MFETVLGLMFKIFFILLLGFFMKRRGVINSNDQKSITTLLMKIVVYFMIIMCSQNEFSLEAAKAIFITAIVAAVMYLIGIPLCMLLAKRLNLPEGKQRIFVCSAMFCNVTFMGYPICLELFGNVGLLCAIMFSMVYNILFYTWGIAYISGGKTNIKAIFTNKIAIASVVTIVMYFLQIRIPEPFAGTFSAIGNMTMPLSMIIAGCSLADSDLLDILKDKRMYIVTTIRMLVCPVAVYTAMRLCGFSGLVLQGCTIMAALPTGTMTSIVAAENNNNPDYAVKMMVQTMLAMVVTLPMWVLIVQG